MNFDQELGQALKAHEAGRLAEAEAAYNRLLALRPDHARVIHMLGLIMLQTNRNELAAKLLTRAAALSPNTADYHANLGVALERLDLAEEAIAAYRQALAISPNDAVVLCNLSDALRRSQPAQALQFARAAVRALPQYFYAHHCLAKCLMSAGDVPRAVEAYRTTLRLKDDLPEVHNELGDALRRIGRSAEAIEEFHRAIHLQPDYARAHSNLGAALLEVDRLEDAERSIRTALSIDESFPEAHTNLGNFFLAVSRHSEAIAAFRRAIELRPDYALAHHQLGWSLLLTGDYGAAWPEYEWRLKVPEFNIPRRDYPRPRWAGEDLSGKRILLYGEQGRGDRIQFARYVPLVARRAAKVFLTCQADLMRLYRGLDAAVELIEPGAPPPEFDVHCSLASLPMLFCTTLATIPPAPYLHADAALSEQWRQRLQSVPAKIKIGLAWAGSPKNKLDRHRSIPLSAFAPLSQIPDAHFFSLQKGDAAQQSAAPPSGMALTDWTADLLDFADTAALIANLDCVITVDTAAAHLAGALGKPCYVLLPTACDWRWLENRPDSAWYASIRLLRQSTRQDWTAPVSQVAQALANAAF